MSDIASATVSKAKGIFIIDRNTVLDFRVSKRLDSRIEIVRGKQLDTQGIDRRNMQKKNWTTRVSDTTNNFIHKFTKKNVLHRG